MHLHYDDVNWIEEEAFDASTFIGNENVDGCFQGATRCFWAPPICSTAGNVEVQGGGEEEHGLADPRGKKPRTGRRGQIYLQSVEDGTEIQTKFISPFLSPN